MSRNCSFCTNKRNRCSHEITKMLQEIVERKGGIILRPYLNIKTLILIQCGEGHQFERHIKSIEQGAWCPKCPGSQRGLVRDHQEVKQLLGEIIERQGGTILSPYVNSENSMLIRCSEGHQFKIRPKSIEKLSWCPECVYSPPGYDQIVQNLNRIVEQQGGVILTPYINMRTNMVIRCSQDHEFKIRPHSLQKLLWCPECLKSSRDFVRQVLGPNRQRFSFATGRKRKTIEE